MSKQVIGWCCALVAVAGLWTTARLTAQEGKPLGVSARHSVEDATQRIKAALNQQLKTPMHYESERLDIVLNAIAEEYDLPIVFDKAALDEVAISPESEVTFNFRNISLRSALKIMFKEPGLEDLCYIVDEEVLLITTRESANETLMTSVYRVDDLLDTRVERFNSSEPPYQMHDRLIDLIISSVEYDSWQENGKGEGEIQYYPPGMVIISQTRRIHDQVEELLAKLRETKRQVLADVDSTASIAKPVTRGFVLDVELGKNPEKFQKQLTAAITGSVDWSKGQVDEQEKWVHFLPERVLVRHLPSVQSQVEVVLADMQLLKSRQQKIRVPGGGGGGGGQVSGGGGGFGISIGGGSGSGGGGSF